MYWNQLLVAGLSTGSIYFLTVPSDHTVVMLVTNVIQIKQKHETHVPPLTFIYIAH